MKRFMSKEVLAIGLAAGLTLGVAGAGFMYNREDFRRVFAGDIGDGRHPNAAWTVTTVAAVSTNGTSAGTFHHSDENAAHEKTESAEREAQENAGLVPTVP
jgi:hypothetical protein